MRSRAAIGFVVCQHIGSLILLIERTRLQLDDPDVDQIARQVMPLGERMKGVASDELLRDLTLELDAVRAVACHGFHPLNTQPSRSIQQMIPVRRQRRTPSGLPVVAPDVGGIAEAVQSGQTGVLLKNAASDGEMVSAYLHAIDWLYEASDRLATLGRGANEHVQARHGGEAYKNQVAAIFRVGAPEDAAMQKVTADETH